jgi:diguanylate cyclase (GGDEF)-like protein/PAS domain S-box-containing protein
MGDVRQSRARARGGPGARTIPPETPPPLPAPATDTPELPRDVEFDLTSVPIVSWSYDPATDDLRWSAPVEELFGVAPGTPGFRMDVLTEADLASAPTAGSTATEVTDLPAAILQPVLAPIRAGAPPVEYDLRTVVVSPDGVTHKLIVRASPSPTGGRLIGGGGGPGGNVYLGAVVDLTEHVYVERELHDVVDRFRLLTDLSPDAIVVHRNGTLVYGNAAAVRLIKAESMEQCYGWPMTPFIHPDDVGAVAERVGQLTEDGQVSEHGEVRVVAMDGSISVVDVTSVRTSWGGQPAYQVIMRDLSERIAAEAEYRYRASLVAHVSDGIIGIDSDGKIESWNEAAASIYGWSEHEVVGRSISEILTGFRTDSASVLERGQRSHVRKDGSPVEVQVSLDPLINEAGMPAGWVVVCAEITEARQALAGRRAAEERYEAVVASLSEGIVLLDENGNVRASNEAAEKILGDRLASGRAHEIFTGSSIAIDVDGHPMSSEMFPHAQTLATGESRDDVMIGVTDGSDRRQWLLVSSRLLSGSDQVDGPMAVCSFTDVTDRQAAEAQLHWLAYHDSLTGLGNRSQFNDELERELMVASQRGTNLAVLFIDLDRFKLINDSFGHAAGDELLLTLAQRFKSAVRGGDLVSRFSGDEFVVLCRSVPDVNVAVSLATEYSRLLADPVELSTGRSVVVTSSVGVAFVAGGLLSAQDILQQADVAMFQAKNKGRSRVEVFDESLRAKSVARLEIYDDLRHAVEHDEMTVHYQPIASVHDDRIVAMEALVRWHHPTRGLLGPMEFIPFAEETDLIFKLGRLVLREACRTMAKWRAELPGAEDAYITVNLSAHQLSDTELLDTIAAALADSGLPPEALVMEVTESMLMTDTSAAIAMLGGIHEMGVGLAIDDFGTGYSSLAQLKRFPVKILKIDKSFVDGLGKFDNDEAIVAAIVQLSKALGLVVLAEGVETPIQLARVAELGCDLYQGYLMSRPTQAESVAFKKKTSPAIPAEPA